MTQGIRVTLGVLALCLIILLIVVSKQMANSRTLRQEVDTVRRTLTTSQQQLEAAQALVQRLQQQVEHTRAQLTHTEAQRDPAATGARAGGPHRDPAATGARAGGVAPEGA